MSATAFILYGFAFVAAICALGIVLISGYLLCSYTVARLKAGLANNEETRN